MNSLTKKIVNRHNSLLASLKKDNKFEAPANYGIDYSYPHDEESLSMVVTEAADVKNAIEKEHAIPFTISVLSIDRDGDIVIPQGLKFDNYKKNPVVFFGHQSWEIPIGKATDKKGQLQVSVNENIAKSVCYFDEQDEDAMFIYGKVMRGFLSAASVAFVPLKAYKRDDHYAKAAQFRDRESIIPIGWCFEEVDVTEWSVVGVPSNAGAMAIRDSLEKEKKFITPKLRKALEPFAEKPKKAFLGYTRPVECKDGKCEPDPIRWNKSLSSVFDVENEPLPPSQTLIDWATKFLECQIKNIYQTSMFVAPVNMGNILTGIKKALADYKLVDTRNIHGGYQHGSESPPIFETIQLNSKNIDTFLVSGCMFLEKPGVVQKGDDGKSYKHKCLLHVRPDWDGIEITLMTRRELDKQCSKIFADAQTWAKENNFLKNEAFSLSGEFLDKTEDSWDDVFLTEKNKGILSRVTKSFNQKGNSFPNRGILFLGPPGTGKTLSGRVMKNTNQGTFIWVSARDFYKSGSFGGIRMAFDMAKELSPSTLFIEDIDNWLDSRTVDLLKTEMDGLTKSKGVMTVLTTNFPERLPEALIDRPGRFHDVLMFDYPDEKSRKAMITKWLESTSVTDKTKNFLVQKSVGYSGAHVYELCQFAKSLTEQEDMDINKAAESAISKIEEQKEMINNLQLRDSFYRPRKSGTKGVKKSCCDSCKKGKSCSCEGNKMPPAKKKMNAGSGTSGGYLVEEEDKDTANEVTSDEEVSEGLENVEGHINDAEAAIEGGDKPLGFQILSNVADHLQNMVEYLQESEGPLEQPEVKDYVGKMMEEINSKIEEVKNIAGEKYPDLGSEESTEEEDEVDEEDVVDKEEETEEEESEETETEEPEEEEEEDDQSTEDLLNQYRNTNKSKKPTNTVAKKVIKKSVITKACDSMKETSDFLKECAEDDAMPKKYKGSCKYYAKALEEAADEMSKGGPDKMDEEVQKGKKKPVANSTIVKKMEACNKLMDKLLGTGY